MKPLLILGKRFTGGDPVGAGGVTVLFELLISELTRLGVDFDCVDLNFRNYPSPPRAYAHIARSITSAPGRYRHVSLHGTAREFSVLGALAVRACRRSPTTSCSLRKFGGSFHDYLAGADPVTRWLANYALDGASHLFFETRYLVDHFVSANPRAHWMPNARPPSSEVTSDEYRGRFVFASRVESGKGVRLLLDTFAPLDSRASLTIYGALSDEFDERDLDVPNVRYGGVLASTDVPAALADHDVLVLPTLWPTEGHPGVIVEALSAGLPVIASDLGGISELLDEECGLLIDPFDADSLEAAVRSLASRDYSTMRAGALRRRELFAADTVTRDYLQVIGVAPGAVASDD